MASKKFVQYVAIRKDLSVSMKWPTGAVIAQACHACTAVVFSFRDDPYTQEYTKNLDSMHKIVVEVADEESLSKLSQSLDRNKMDFKLWVEQPENYPTCLATKPYPREEVSKYFKGFKLYQ
ncbi:putative peptidyl-tRNA hydrolase PTRHD1 [Xenia sp. Carnegie-2017]|uniref:putative peptidyl-tRNA hydrolase PTRHD1 n=1 Tax=Xenia sp. Carnegie-2017 TaxID=2897299 RepID=UPI001F044951|nr:putative peptidyl-tRNA hydrolase PTRHD1 [Xenia sp. Carnegie-2017]